MNDSFGFFFAVFEFIFGVYLLWGAFKNKGKIFATDGIRAEKLDKFLKMTRIMSFVVGGILTVLGVLQWILAMQRSNGVENFAMRIIVSVLLVLSFVAIVTMVLLAKSMTDKNARRKDRPGGRGTMNMPTSAFEFETEEEGQAKFSGTNPAKYKSKK